MSFNRAIFNRAPFNHTKDNIINIFAEGTETVEAMIGTALNYSPLAIGNERIRSEVIGEPFRIVSVLFTETVDSDIVCLPTYYITCSGAETVDCSGAEHGADIELKPVGTENITLIKAGKGANISISPTGAETVYKIVDDRSMKPGASFSANVFGYELVSESSSVEAVETKVCVLKTTLKPGQILIVDASSYNVLLDGENAIDIHSGDWLDELNRSTTDLRISASSGAAYLSASLLYTERYL